jgi:MFS family permease
MSWLMWGLVAGFYLFGFFQRVAPAVMVDELMREFHIGGAILGNLSATYFYSYTLMQIPSGLLADGIGPRRLSTMAAFLAGVGTLMFGLANHLWMAYAGRLLVGASVGVAFVTCMKLAGHWFPPNRFATVTGVALLLGNFGGVLAGVPLSEAISAFGWRASMVWWSGWLCGTTRESVDSKATSMPRSSRMAVCLPCALCAASRPSGRPGCCLRPAVCPRLRLWFSPDYGGFPT